ncbi:hypothetical protein GDO78_019380 [Eleutherodactylus coqui]|uniref:Uncharacterized protein n=1 Tax=Eleutherodactylus coqui TaxID=57060 RepID=A0A8J6B7V7_ELECQ|nr:hypothetical protein GDO78_019380 [Eleutherodactylus coqui]
MVFVKERTWREHQQTDQINMPYMTTYWTQRQAWSQKMNPCICVFNLVKKEHTMNYTNEMLCIHSSVLLALI